MSNYRILMQREKRMVLHARNKDEKPFRSAFLVIVSFVLPLLLLIPALIYMGILPFGDTTTLAVDLRNQYIGFYEAFRGALSDPGSLLYNFTKGPGGIMSGTDAYYLFSPLNLVLLLLPSDLVPVGVEAIQFVKIGLAGAFFSLLLIHREHGEDWRVILFSTAYALMSFAMANLLNLMWLESVWMLPLVVLFLERMLDGKNAIPYILSLALAIFMNFYSAFMLCLFLLPYAIWTIVRRPRERGYGRGGWTAECIRRFVRFGIFSLVAGMLVAWVLLPTVYSLLLSKGPYQDQVVGGLTLQYPLPDPFTRILPAAFNYDQVSNGYANIYSGTVTVMLSVFYFFNRHITKRERFISLLIVAFLLASMNLKALNLLWHGFQYPIWYNYRFSWVFTFFALLIGFRGFRRWKGLRPLPTIAVLLGYGGLIAYVFLKQQADEKAFPFLTIWHLGAAAALVLLYLIFLGLYGKKKRRVAAAAILLFSCLELATNAAFYLGSFNYETLSEFRFFDHTVNEALADIRPKQGEFYRIEKNFMHDSNDNMRFHISSLTHFNSTYEYNTVEMLSSLGFARARASTAGGNATKLTDALFGIRYYLEGVYDENSTQAGMGSLKSKSHRPDLANMNQIQDTGLVRVYENPRAMPFGMIAEPSLAEYEIGRKNPIDLQDDIANMLDGKSEKTNYFVRQPLQEDPELENLKTDNPNADIREYKRLAADKSTPARLNYTIHTSGKGSAYLTISETFNSSNSRIYLDNEEIGNKRTGDVDSSQILNVSAAGDGAKTQKLSIQMDSDKSSFRLNNIALFELDEPALKDLVDYQNETGLKLNHFRSTSFGGTFTAKEDAVLLLSLPYDAGWKATIDGEPVETQLVLHGLTSIPVRQGEHTLEMRFTHPLLYPGLALTAAGLLCLLIVASSEHHRKKEAKKAKETTAERMPDAEEPIA